MTLDTATKIFDSDSGKCRALLPNLFKSKPALTEQFLQWFDVEFVPNKKFFKFLSESDDEPLKLKSILAAYVLILEHRIKNWGSKKYQFLLDKFLNLVRSSSIPSVSPLLAAAIYENIKFGLFIAYIFAESLDNVGYFSKMVSRFSAKVNLRAENILSSVNLFNYVLETLRAEKLVGFEVLKSLPRSLAPLCDGYLLLNELRVVAKPFGIEWTSQNLIKGGDLSAQKIIASICVSVFAKMLAEYICFCGKAVGVQEDQKFTEPPLPGLAKYCDFNSPHYIGLHILLEDAQKKDLEFSFTDEKNFINFYKFEGHNSPGDVDEDDNENEAGEDDDEVMEYFYDVSVDGQVSVSLDVNMRLDISLPVSFFVPEISAENDVYSIEQTLKEIIQLRLINYSLDELFGEDIYVKARNNFMRNCSLSEFFERILNNCEYKLCNVIEKEISSVLAEPYSTNVSMLSCNTEIGAELPVRTSDFEVRYAAEQLVR